MKRIILVLLAVMLFFALTLSFCMSPRIESVVLGRFPDNIVYYAGESGSVDLTGATIIRTIRDGRRFEEHIYNDRHLEITHNVDFSVPGVYEVVIRRWQGGEHGVLVGRIPIQVIEREYTSR